MTMEFARMKEVTGRCKVVEGNGWARSLKSEVGDKIDLELFA